MSDILLRFRDCGWVERCRDPEDGRLRRYRLTTFGRNEHPALVKPLSPDMQRVLSVLADVPVEGLSIAQVARRACLTHHRATTLLARMATNGWACWERPPNDYRRHCYRLTEQGRHKHAEIVAAHQTHDQGEPNR